MASSLVEKELFSRVGSTEENGSLLFAVVVNPILDGNGLVPNRFEGDVFVNPVLYPWKPAGWYIDTPRVGVMGKFVEADTLNAMNSFSENGW